MLNASFKVAKFPHCIIQYDFRKKEQFFEKDGEEETGEIQLTRTAWLAS